MRFRENWHHTASKGINLRSQNIARFRAVLFPCITPSLPKQGSVGSGGLLPLPANGILLSRCANSRLPSSFENLMLQKSPVPWFIFSSHGLPLIFHSYESWTLFPIFLTALRMAFWTNLNFLPNTRSTSLLYFSVSHLVHPMWTHLDTVINLGLDFSLFLESTGSSTNNVPFLLCKNLWL